MIGVRTPGIRAVGGRGARPVEPHAAMNHLRIGKDLRQIVDRTRRHADGFELFQKLGARQARGECAQMPDQFGAMRQARFVVDVFFFLGERRLAQDGAQLGELAVVARGDDDVPVGDRKHLIGRDVGMRIAHAARYLAGDEIIERLIGEHADGGIDQGGIDIAAAAGLFPPRQRREDADGRIDAGEQIRNRRAGAHRFAVGIAGQVHHPAHALGHEIVAGALCIRTGLTEARHRAIDQPRVVRREALIVETEFGEPADLEIFDQHVRARRKLAHDAASFLALEVELDRTLAAVGGVEISSAEMAAVGRGDERRPPAAGVVACALALDLDHVRTQVGQDLPGPRPRQDTGQFQHAQTGQWTRHEKLPQDARGKQPGVAYGTRSSYLRSRRRSGAGGPNGGWGGRYIMRYGVVETLGRVGA